MENIKKIIHYLKDYDIGIGLDLEPDCKAAIIFTDNRNIDESFATLTNNVYYVSENPGQYEHLKSKYPDLNLFEGNILNTNLEDNNIDFILADSGIINFDNVKVRNELKRISSLSGYADVVILENEINSVKDNEVKQEFLEFLYAGSWYETKEFEFTDSNGTIIKTKIYHNPTGFNEAELKTEEVTEFIKACEDYCEVIENFNKYSVKDFLYNVQKTLVRYYSAGFDLPDCCGSDGNTTISTEYTKRDVNEFFKLSNELLQFLDDHNIYWSNFNPYPEVNDKETSSHSLANDLSEIYEDIKLNIYVFKNGNLYDKQEMLWQFKFDWRGHTGDHWTFAVRAIHWKLQELEYDDE